MSGRNDHPATLPLKRKRSLAAESSLVDSSLPPPAKQRPNPQQSPSTASVDPEGMASTESWKDIPGFLSRSVQVLKESTSGEFMEFLTMAVDNVLVSAAESPMTPQSLASALKEMRPHDLSLPSQILDVINQYWTDQPADGRSRLGAFLKALIESGVVSTELAIELVDRNILQDSGIISNSQILNTRTVRINTGLLYKQQKFNLLREENEGYGKLSHEFNLALSELPKGGFVDSADLAAKSEELLTVVDALIGYFELDPNRVLDNILDICSQNLLSHARFILHFLHSSPWAPPSKSVSLPFTAVDKTEKRRRLDSMQQDFTGYYKTEMSRLGGSRLAAQLLGFKFRFFASTVDGDGKGNTSSPESLVFLTALLIKSGFIRLSDIYPYLSPTDSTIVAEYGKWKGEMDDKAFMAKSNPLALAGALGDDESGDVQKAAVQEKTDSKETDRPKRTDTNQKVSLLHALLAVGCLPSALQLLSLHPQISGPYQVVSDGIHRILHVSIDRVYAPFSPSRQFDQIAQERLAAQKRRAAPNRTPSGSVDWLSEMERKSVRGYSPFPKQEFGDLTVRFFLDDDMWADDIPLCETMEDFYSIAVNFLRFSGPRVGNDVSLLVKLARLGKGQFLNGHESPSLLRQWVNIARLFLIPAISLVGANAGVVNEIYDLIRYFPYTTRFSLYGEWQTSAYKMHPELKLKSSETDKDTKGILRRISKQNVKQFGRALAKKSTSNPLILWAIAINQIEFYDNFVEVVVDAAKFCTNFGYDVLEYIILSSLASPFKNRVKEDGTSVAVWLTGLSAFCAKLFRRYAYMDVSMAATYIVCQLKSSNIYDLIVLRELLTQMTGILVRENLSDYQLSCYQGGDVLKEQAMSLLRGPGAAVGWKKPSARLLKALTENNLAGLLVILIAQERGGSLFNLNTQQNSNLKLLGNLFDECHGVLLQYHDFIAMNMDAASLETLLPTFETMIRDYGVEPSVAFYLWRPILAERIKQYDVDLTIQMQKKKLLQGLAGSNPSAGMEDVKPSPSSTIDPEPQNEVSPPKTEPAEVKDDVDGQSDGQPVEEYVPLRNSLELPTDYSPWHPALRGFIEEAGRVLPADVWNFMSPQYYTTFWQLSSYEISPPMQAYTQEVEKLTSQIKASDADRSDTTPVGVLRKRRERERSQALIDQLNQEFKTQTVAYQMTKKRLAKEKDFWFDWAKLPSGPETIPPRNRTVLAMLQHCIIPRCVFGPNEAIFCARFIRDMHKLGTKNFSSLTLFDKIFVNLTETVIFTCTNREAENYGRFLRELLSELSRWYANKSTYDKEAIGPSTPGFLKKWSVNPVDAIYLQYEEFRSVMFKWHKNLTTAFKNCLESKDYMHVRNALAVLEKISGHYPLVDFHGTSLEENVSIIASKLETRGDLQVRAQGYLALLRKSSKTWVTAAKFSAQIKSAASPANSSVYNRPTTPRGSTSSTSVASNTQFERAQPALNPAAPAFKPQESDFRKSNREGSKGVDSSVHPTKLEPALEVMSSSKNRDSQAKNDTTVGANASATESIRDTAADRGRNDDGPRDSSSRRGRTNGAESNERTFRQRSDQNPMSTEQSRTQQYSRMDRSTRSRDDFQDPKTVVNQVQDSRVRRLEPIASGQNRSFPETRSRTPEGPRGNTDGRNEGQKGPSQHDLHLTRPPRYDNGRMNIPAPRLTPGFRAPPPTGPRGSGISPPVSGFNNSRPQHSGRILTSVEPLRGVLSTAPPPHERSEQGKGTDKAGTTPLAVHPDRAAMLGFSARDAPNDSSKSQRPTSATESRSSRTRTSHTDGPPSKLDQSVPPSEAPKGPSDWRVRPKRDLQDEDPRRLSRAPDWSNEGSEPERASRSTEEKKVTKPTQSLEAEQGKGTGIGKERSERDRDDEDQKEGKRGARDIRKEAEMGAVAELRKSRTNPRSENNDRDSASRNRSSLSTKSQHDSSTEVVKSRDSGKKDVQPAEQKASSRELRESVSRDSKDPLAHDPKAASHRQDESSRRKDDRDVTRSKKDEPKESRHERSRDGHHGRSSARRSPSRTQSDRGDKKERERDSERRTGSRRESRDLDHREKDRPQRESDHRRDARERERSGRERDPEGRRASRKHERDKSADALDRGGRSGETAEGSTGGDSTLPIKRRRVVR